MEFSGESPNSATLSQLKRDYDHCSEEIDWSKIVPASFILAQHRNPHQKVLDNTIDDTSILKVSDSYWRNISSTMTSHRNLGFPSPPIVTSQGAGPTQWRSSSLASPFLKPSRALRALGLCTRDLLWFSSLASKHSEYLFKNLEYLHNGSLCFSVSTEVCCEEVGDRWSAASTISVATPILWVTMWPTEVSSCSMPGRINKKISGHGLIKISAYSR